MSLLLSRSLCASRSHLRRSFAAAAAPAPANARSVVRRDFLDAQRRLAKKRTLVHVVSIHVVAV